MAVHLMAGLASGRNIEAGQLILGGTLVVPGTYGLMPERRPLGLGRVPFNLSRDTLYPVSPPRLWLWLSLPPAMHDEPRTRRATLQLRLLRFVLLAIPFIFGVALLDPVNTVLSVAAVWVPVAVTLIAVAAMVRRGWLDLAGWIMTLTIWLLVSGSMWLFGGLPPNNAVGYVIAVMVAAAALGARHAIFFAVLSALAAGLVAWAESAGVLPKSLIPLSLFNVWIAITATLVLAAALHTMAIQSLDQALLRSSRALSQLRETQHENETRGLHGAALAQLAERALLASDPRNFCAEAARVATSILSLDDVFLLEFDEQRRATLQKLTSPSGAMPAPILVEGTALDQKPERLLYADDAQVRVVLEQLGAGRPTSAMLAPVRGRSYAHGFLGVSTPLARTFSPTEEQFVATLASIIGTLIERDQAAERAQRAQKLEVVGRLASAVAHDFNNLLTAIVGTAQALRDEQSNATRTALIDELDAATDRAGLLTRQLLAFSRRQVITMTKLDLGAQLRDSLPMLRRLLGDHIVVDAALPVSPAFVDADRGSIDQLVLNLMVNARDAMPGGGTISAAVETAGDGGAVLRVRDHGPGMDEATRRRIFQPFFTTKAYGTGLGLATVADIVQRHAAVIEVESAPGQGAVFTVKFRPSVATPTELPVVEGPQLGQGRVLLAEDHPLVRANTARMLESIGYAVVAVGSGSEARDRLAADHSYAVLVTDVTMPDLSGPELANQLATLGITIPILFISGYVEQIPESAAGVSRFLPKPFTREEIGAAVAACLRAARNQ